MLPEGKNAHREMKLEESLMSMKLDPNRQKDYPPQKYRKKQKLQKQMNPDKHLQSEQSALSDQNKFPLPTRILFVQYMAPSLCKKLPFLLIVFTSITQ